MLCILFSFFTHNPIPSHLIHVTPTYHFPSTILPYPHPHSYHPTPPTRQPITTPHTRYPTSPAYGNHFSPPQIQHLQANPTTSYHITLPIIHTFKKFSTTLHFGTLSKHSPPPLTNHTNRQYPSTPTPPSLASRVTNQPPTSTSYARYFTRTAHDKHYSPPPLHHLLTTLTTLYHLPYSITHTFTNFSKTLHFHTLFTYSPPPTHHTHLKYPSTHTHLSLLSHASNPSANQHAMYLLLHSYSSWQPLPPFFSPILTNRLYHVRYVSGLGGTFLYQMWQSGVDVENKKYFKHIRRIRTYCLFQSIWAFFYRANR